MNHLYNAATTSALLSDRSRLFLLRVLARLLIFHINLQKPTSETPSIHIKIKTLTKITPNSKTRVLSSKKGLKNWGFFFFWKIKDSNWVLMGFFYRDWCWNLVIWWSGFDLDLGFVCLIVFVRVWNLLIFLLEHEQCKKALMTFCI